MPLFSPSASLTQDHYNLAKKLIPGGTQLLSKRPEMHAPDIWPAYFKSAAGITITDLDGRVYRDFSTMGIGACLLGYANAAVNDAVVQRVKSGATCSLNAPEEVDLAARLTQIHPWADNVRFTRAGGEAMAVAVRIARAHTGRSVVAVCGYHGWNDWYLAANLTGDDSLSGHLLPGLEPAGVPSELAGTILTFRYNKPEELAEIVALHGPRLAAIVMEPMRYVLPEDDFLERARQAADQTGSVLIFDEITSGWRSNLGGIHLKFGVEPDIAVFAKALANGFALGAIMGRSEVMEASQKSFISSTSWTEGVGPVAAVATISELERLHPWQKINDLGLSVIDGWRRLGRDIGIPLTAMGQGSLCALQFQYGKESNAVRTLFTQEMLSEGYLAGSGFYPSAAHTSEDVGEYLEAVIRVFQKIKAAAESGNIHSFLKSREADQGFKRLT